VQLGPTSLESLSALSETPCNDLLVSIEEAQQARLLSADPCGIAFRHGLMQEWLYRSLTQPERRYLHSATASYLASRSAAVTDIAFHLHRAGEEAAAAKASLAAADDALERGACADAVAFLEMALDNTLSEVDRFHALEKLSSLYDIRGNLTKALRTAESALRLAGASAEQSLVWTLRIRRAAAAAELGADPPLALQRELAVLMTEAEDDEDFWLRAVDTAVTLANSTLDNVRARELLKQLEGRRFSGSRIQCRAFLLSTFYLAHGSPSVAAAASEAAIRLAEEQGHQDLLMRAICRAVIVHSWRGTLDDGKIRRWKKRAGEIARDTGDIRGFWTFHVNVATWFIDTLRTEEGRQWIEAAKRMTGGAFDAVMDIGLENNLGELHLLEHDYEAALTHFRRAAAAPQSMRQEIHLSACGGLGYCLLAKGRIREALRIDADLPASDTLTEIKSFDPSTIILFRARILSVKRRLKEALRTIRRSRSTFRDRHLPAWLKLGKIELRILRRLEDDRGYKQCLGAVVERADELGLKSVVDQFMKMKAD